MYLVSRLVGIVERFTAGAEVGESGRLDVNADKLKLRVLDLAANDVGKDGVQYAVTGTGNQVSGCISSQQRR